MPTPKTLKALLLPALLTAAVTLPAASAAPVYFENGSGASGVVDVYVDGELVFNDVFADSAMMFPRDIAAGPHQVVVTPFSLAPGQADVLDTAVTIPDDGTSTLTLGPGQDDLGRDVLALSLEGGHAR
ncbi:hypothetical protein DAERI_210004 [Deinococcus aerius]|uniref:DUF4397 domain-containing protein n=1 Tax=Deinococcus aerius TaxID=200253 RepID=A0A2I9DN41_9DEIO|nr:hypothetical protein [Deinococcus aerius]GBF08008.1 hypothetical protein DAERI_210004 [Deinococcus aerius]